MKEMIRRDRNHPSIMIWSMGNETNRAVDSKFAVAEDTTRILTARRVSEGSAGKYVKHNDDNLPIENLLRCTIRGWYNKDVKDLEPSDGQHSGTEEHQQNMLKASGLFGTGNLCTWLYEDHGADREYLNSPLLHVNPKGYVDVYRVPKYAYYFWQATYAKKPMVFIQPHFWRSQYLGQKRDIVVNSNCDKVELKVNGVSKGTQTPDAANFHSVTFKDITIEKGTVTAAATKSGINITAQVVMADEPAKIVLTSAHKKITADRGSVAIITADIVDGKGNHVYGASNSVKWTVTGPAVLVGPSVYDSDIDRHHEMEGVWYIDMPVSNVIRSTGKPGKIKVTVSAGGLASGSFEIDAEAFTPDNSVITEPLLEDEGRKKVIRLVLTPSRLEETPREIKLSFDGFKLASSDKQGYARTVRETIKKNNPDVLERQRQLIQARQSVAQSRAEKGLNADLFASFGLSQRGDKFDGLYVNPQQQERVRLGIEIPLMDWGLARGKYKMAQSAQEVVKTNVAQAEMDFEQEVLLQVMQFNLQDDQLVIAAKADTIARLRYEVTKQRFLIGKISVLDLNVALQEKDIATRAYIEALRNYWNYFFNMRSLTLFDWINNQTLSEEFDNLIR